MKKRANLGPVLGTIALMLASAAHAAAQQELTGTTWSAETGLGYDSNAFNAPRSAYMDYAVGATQNQVVVPQAKSGFFIPYMAQVEMGMRQDQNTRMTGSATLSGRKYLGGLGNADELNLDGKGGLTFDLSNGGKFDKEAYAGLVLEKHRQAYVDHDSGAPKVTAGGSNISNRYNYTTFGFEGELKEDREAYDYSIGAQYLQNNYDDPLAVSKLDHTYTAVDGKLDYKLKKGAKLKFSLGYSIRDYSVRPARDANGVSAAANPLLKYVYNDFGVSLRDRLSKEWVYYIDYDYSSRTDSFVHYNDYNSHRIGGRVIYELGPLKGRASLHYWRRDYQNAFAFDIAGQPQKTYSGTDLRFQAEMAQPGNMAYWAELILDSQNSTDKRFAYSRNQLMGGVRWDM